MIVNTQHSNMLVSPARTIVGRVELYRGSTLLQTFRHTDALKEFTVNRAGDKKFFGFGVCQEIEVKLVDKERVIDILKDDALKVSFGVNDEFVKATPTFYVSEVTRDENTNEITVKAYDTTYKAKSHTVAELNLQAPYSPLAVLMELIWSEKLNIASIDFVNITDETGAAFFVEYPEGANFEGTETIRELLDDIAEATQTIYYINADDILLFKRLDIAEDPVVTINKADYFTLESKENRTLENICSATELGDNVIVTTGVEGETQYVRDNPFWELREDITELLDEAISIVGGTTITQFSCEWRGNYLLEPGDKIAIVAKDNSRIVSYLLNDKYTYNGGFSASTAWEYGEKNGESVDNPTTLGEALKKTYAKVDKTNKEIEIVAGETAAIKLTTNSINNSVSQLDDNMTDVIAEVNTKVTANEVSYSIQTAMGEGIERVTTTTGFTFNEEGLHISKENSEITTSITQDGMTVYKNDEEVLVADNLGVRAEDLHATTFLIIGNNSRLEDYGNRTGCFWIGG